MNLTIKPCEQYIEIDILLEENKIGRAEIEINKKYLSCFEIFSPYQNQGYGQQALKLLIEKYGIEYLSVKKDNERAIHVYKKLGFEIGDYGTFYSMKLKSNNT